MNEHSEAMNERFRNSATVVVKNVATTAAILLSMTIWFFIEQPQVAIGVIVVIALLTAAFCWRWYRTLIELTDEGMIIERNTVFKLKRTIPYIKIASINADRSVIDRIFGTVSLKVNINTSTNVLAPEAVLTLKKEFAETIRETLSLRIFDREVTEPGDDEGITFSNTELVLHGLFSMSSYQTLFAIAVLVYAVIVSLFAEGGLAGVLLALFIVLTIHMVPAIMTMIRFHGFKVSRIGDTIHIKHGAVQNYKTSFEISRINAVRIRRTFFARLLKSAYIEAEVVGISAAKNDQRPLICILCKMSSVRNVMETIVPEFIYVPYETKKQPPASKWPMLLNAAVVLAAILPALGYLSLNIDHIVYDTEWIAWAQTAIPTVMVIITAGVLAGIYYSIKLRGFDIGDHMFTFSNGILDRETSIISYGKVQIAETGAGIMARRLGLAKCNISLLSTLGTKKIGSGYFTEEDLKRIPDRMLELLEYELSCKILTQNDPKQKEAHSDARV
ncbi:MAG: PH domain-containing protein [Methanomassiliicoccaceae archaeon]|nr:PH domain-containing protein [Methanomassiliicoccaceae archaeon]